jgi:GNAT superfamily N-acetyltransferase
MVAIAADRARRAAAALTSMMKSRSDPKGQRTPAVRPLTAADASDATALYDSLTVGPKGTTAQAFEAVIAHPGTSVLGVEDGGRIWAMLTVHILPNPTWGGRPYALIENVITAPQRRSQGLGRQLMNAAIAHAWAEDAYRIMIISSRPEAIAFYRALGFSSEGKCAMGLAREAH